ncbi:MAG: hypothetical protein Q4C70_13680 [Planctomycetia bacterium]|nr:hypothetical protein [Planctomycetia bacterium]
MLQDTKLLELWEFLLCAWWKRTASGRIFVAVEQEKLVKALWAVCRILPESLWQQLSFSTYEKDAMLSPAIIVGLWDPIQPEESIPQTCFNGTNLAWNTFSGKKSTIQGIPRYIQYIIQAVKNGKITEIDSFHSGTPSVTWHRRASAETFFELVRHPDTMDITRLKDISDLPKIGRFAIKNEKRFRLLLENFFTSPLLDMWDENTIQLVYTPFFASDGEVLQKFHEQLIQIQKDRISACDVDFLKMFEQKWLPRLKNFEFSEMDLWPLFNDSPASLPKPIYQWIYPTAFRHVLHCHEPSEQIEFLTRWCFLDVDEVNEPQITGILQSNFADIVKLTMYSKFVERDMAGNDAQFSRFYFAWPEWNVQVLLKLAPETRNRFLDYLIPTAGPTLLSAIQTQLTQNGKNPEMLHKNADLFRIYCDILASPNQIPITKSVADFARRLPQDEVLAIREALQKREDLVLLNQKKELNCIFSDNSPSCFWSRLLFWKKS